MNQPEEEGISGNPSCFGEPLVSVRGPVSPRCPQASWIRFLVLCPDVSETCVPAAVCVFLGPSGAAQARAGVGSSISGTPFTHYIPRRGGAPSCWVSIDSGHFV